MAYEFLAAGIKPADPFGGFMRGLEQGTQFQQNRQINAVNIEAAKNRNETAGLELQQAKKQVEAETQWSKLPRDEAGNVDPASDKQYRAQYPEYWETRKKAEIAQSIERLQLVGETLKTGAALFANVKTPGDTEKIREWSKQNLAMDPGEFSAEVYGLASQYSDELAKRTEQRRQDMATAVANKDYDVINVLEKQQADDQEAATIKTRLAQLEIGQKAADIRAKDASANKSNAQAEAARTGTNGKPLTVTQEIAVTKENERIAKQQQKKDLLIASTDETIDTIKSAIKGIGFTSSGITGKIAGAIPGTDTYDQVNVITTIKSNIGFDRLQAMRDASPTGGALGQVAIQELVALQASIASLDIGQTEAVQKKNLNKVLKHYENWKRTITGESVLKDSGGEKPKVKKTISFADLPE